MSSVVSWNYIYVHKIKCNVMQGRVLKQWAWKWNKMKARYAVSYVNFKSVDSLQSLSFLECFPLQTL